VSRLALPGAWPVWLAAATLALLALVSVSWLALPASLPTMLLTAAAERYWYGLPDPRRTRVFYSALVSVPTLLVPLLFGSAFVLWCGPLRHGDVRLPARSLVVAALLAALSAAWYAKGWSYGLKYQGAELLGRYVVLSVILLVALGVLAVLAHRQPTAWSSLGFHAVLFGWVIAVGFPWLGETC